MKTALDIAANSLDEHEVNFLDKIREHGWFGTHVFGDDDNLGFSYTTGFYLRFGKPELLIFSLKREIAHDVFWDVFRRLEKGEEFVENTPSDQVFQNGPSVIFPVFKKRFKEYLGWSLWFYQWQEFSCSQIIWSDRKNNFPWHLEFQSEFADLQNDLTSKGWLKSLKH